MRIGSVNKGNPVICFVTGKANHCTPDQLPIAHCRRQWTEHRQDHSLIWKSPAWIHWKRQPGLRGIFPARTVADLPALRRESSNSPMKLTWISPIKKTMYTAATAAWWHSIWIHLDPGRGDRRTCKTCRGWQKGFRDHWARHARWNWLQGSFRQRVALLKVYRKLLWAKLQQL